MSSENGHPAERNTADELSDRNDQAIRLTAQLTALMQRKRTLQRQLLDEIFKKRQL